MKLKFKSIFFYVVFVAVLISFCSGYAQPEGPDSYRHSRRHQIEANLAKELGLSAEQQKRIEEQRMKNKQRSIEIKRQINTKMVQLKEELNKTKINKAGIKKTISELKNLKGRELEQHVKRILSIREILTPEQYNKLTEKMRQQEQKFQERSKCLQQGTMNRKPEGGFMQRFWRKEQGPEGNL